MLEHVFVRFACHESQRAKHCGKLAIARLRVAPVSDFIFKDLAKFEPRTDGHFL
jgi:hypothetical protein